MRYHYRGPVMHFEHCISKVDYWVEAKSSKQALVMLSGRYKRENGFAMRSAIKLDAKYLKESG